MGQSSLVFLSPQVFSQAYVYLNRVDTVSLMMEMYLTPHWMDMSSKIIIVVIGVTRFAMECSVQNSCESTGVLNPAIYVGTQFQVYYLSH